MRKRGEYQRHKKRQERVNDIITYIMVFIFTLSFAYVILEKAVSVHQINQGSLQEYTGSYSYTISRWRGRSKTKFIFTLDNGKVLTVRTGACENEALLDQCDELTFQYSDIPSNPLWGIFTAQSITTPDGDTTIRNINDSKRGNVGTIWILSIILFLWLSLWSVLLVLCRAEKRLSRYQKWRKKKQKT